ncbi:MAG TPA: hypothetical protein VFF52_22410 [Isosphaeraceae bacterium]|nr:hypothetical protein [Isosphaeraceae bacterium]
MFPRRGPWLPRPALQWTLGEVMIAVVLCATGLARARLPLPLLILLALAGGLTLDPLLLARRSFRLIDIITVLAIALLTIGLLLPAMVQTRCRTAGGRTFPVTVPASVHSLLFGDR